MKAALFPKKVKTRKFPQSLPIRFFLLFSRKSSFQLRLYMFILPHFPHFCKGNLHLFCRFAFQKQFLEDGTPFLKEKLYNFYASRAFCRAFLSIMPNFCKFLKNRLQKQALGDIIMCGLKIVIIISRREFLL